MNCYNECNRFFHTKDQRDLGNINQLGSCSNCLTWQEGVGRPLFQYTSCPCVNTIQEETRNGTRNLTVDGYNKVVTCLDKYKSTGSNCGVLYSNWTNTQPINFEERQHEKENAVAPLDYCMYNFCNKKRRGQQGSYPGVF
jgi:hypothetical protein